MSRYVDLANWSVLYNIIPNCRWPISFGMSLAGLDCWVLEMLWLTVVFGFRFPR